MSFIERVPPSPPEGFSGRPQPQRRSPWRWFPLGITAAMLVVIAVNGYMIWQATSTFPGSAGEDGFDLSNAYGKVLDRAAAEAALGWSVKAELDGARPVLRLTTRDGAPLAGAQVTAQAERPLGPPDRTRLTFHAARDGSYVSTEPLPAIGQWDLLLTVTRDGQVFHATPRVVMK